jgi:hypothetical protein
MLRRINPAERMRNDRPDLISLEDVARDYLRTHAVRVEEQMAWFASRSLTLHKAIERACVSIIDGGLYSHQQRPFTRWPQAPKEAANLLTASASCIAAASDFNALYTTIGAKLAPVQGIGPLASYDFAQRIGQWLRPKLEPTEVFLHRGTREGAKALGLRVDRDCMPMSDLPEGLRSLTPAQVEDMLCIYRIPLARIASNGQDRPKTALRGMVRCAAYPAQQRTPRSRGC